MKNTETYSQKSNFRIVVEHTYLKLVKSKKQDDKVTFNQQLLKILPEVKKYINGRLNTAIKKGHFSKGKYKADDFSDQLFIEIYDHIETIKDEKDFYLWVFKKTNELLEDTIIEEEFDDLFFQNIDDYSKPEWDAMQEKFSTDGDGDLLMIEELDDSSYNHNDYTLNHVFIENDEKEMTEKLDKDLSEEAVNLHIQMVLHNLPVSMRTVFELSTQQRLGINEIAQVIDSTVKEVEQLLKDARNALQISLFNRCSTKATND
ncbi:sigma-70 family RNA polymerase sigma factor [Subsaximicrobium wynnwilliamsii]|uniref:Sigma-70 family RNA polymerase sigma factor n=1 Tax=Subsaximicrobium wynnwilliamsii TaxID=291179 RepID=A0A5C6ZIT2_9FLAO|nr:sigma-70 family RNA polymerase sigma factor [Subsaximicrobium wynnwilliamsii]TXD84457.1 sigma-70 family RNA polymerase sigma factor [Subsaximicrobium wynnwilliamsii]TXD90138.1 sigma-70 family RNA polymerase sigma factor [Subsaximicrobium wynnwilliamsii]TXE04190.1 sigma-70 family RNA polymerase sigma factor [Subsaximicrobium wynnwilliamsii]